MTANKRKVAGTAAAVAFAGIAALTIGQHGGFAPAAPEPDTGSHHAPAAVADGASAAGRGKAAVHKTGDKPLWRSLTPAQQRALHPLQEEWDQMDGARKQKWLQLAKRFDAMRPEEQQRMHERMREWIKLTPEQRELARETYNRTRRIAPEQKNATWQSYQQLPEEQKKKLAASAGGRKATVAPAQSGKVVTPLGQGATACPAGTVKNTVSATPPCVAPPPPSQPVQPPSQPPAVQPPQPAPPPPEKQVPANWGITPNNA